jgi:prolyl oligopeptidase PreP (S9A serine peptidase family)
VKLPIPQNADIQGVLDARAIVTLREPGTTAVATIRTAPSSAYALQGGAAELVFAPSDTQSVEDVGIGETGLVVQYLDNVSGRVRASRAAAKAAGCRRKSRCRRTASPSSSRPAVGRMRRCSASRA